MKLAYIHVGYKWESYGVVRVLLEALRRRYPVDELHLRDIRRAKNYPVIIVADAGTNYPLSNVPFVPNSIVIVMGFADPVSFRQNRFNRANLLCTSSLEISRKFPGKTLYFPPYTDGNYFKPLDIPKPYDCVLVGNAIHHKIPHRRAVVEELRDAGLRVLAAGRGFDKHPDELGYITGDKLVEAFNSARFSLDITTEDAPLSSRLFQAAACCTPTITLDREDVGRLLAPGRQILRYRRVSTTVEDILKHVAEADGPRIGRNARRRVLSSHTADARVSVLAKEINRRMEIRTGKKSKG